MTILANIARLVEPLLFYDRWIDDVKRARYEQTAQILLGQEAGRMIAGCQVFGEGSVDEFCRALNPVDARDRMAGAPDVFVAARARVPTYCSQFLISVEGPRDSKRKRRHGAEPSKLRSRFALDTVTIRFFQMPLHV